MENIVNLIPPDCQEIHYRYDFNTYLRHAFICEENRLVEAINSALPFDPLHTFYWREDVNNPDFRREDLRLDAEVKEDGRVMMQIHPGLFRSPEWVDLESVWFEIVGKDLKPGDVITMGEVGFIWVMAFLRDGCRTEIVDDKLWIRHPKPGDPAGPEAEEKKSVAAAPEKRAEVKRLKVAPGDVVKYARKEGVKRSSVVIFRGLYRGSWWGNSSKLWVWHEPKHRNGRWNTGGLADLVDRTGYCMDTVSDGLKELQAVDVIYKRAHGRKGVTNTIWELPKKKGHVMAWKRKPKRPKK